MKIYGLSLARIGWAGASAAGVLIVVLATQYARTHHGDTPVAHTAARAASPSPSAPAGSEWIWLSDMDWVSATNSWGPVERDTSNGENAAGDGHTITLNGVTYAKGLGVVPDSTITYDLGSRCTRLVTDIGIDDEVDFRGHGGSVVFQVSADGKKIYDSGVRFGIQWSTSVLPSETSTLHVDLPIAGVNELKLITQPWYDGFDDDHADWAGARVLCGKT